MDFEEYAKHDQEVMGEIVTRIAADCIAHDLVFNEGRQKAEEKLRRAGYSKRNIFVSQRGSGRLFFQDQLKKRLKK